MVLATSLLILLLITLFNLSIHVVAIPFSSDISPIGPIVVRPPTRTSDIQAPHYATSTTSVGPTSTYNASDMMNEAPIGYTPTNDPLIITVYPPSSSNQTVTITQPALTTTIHESPITTVITVTITAGRDGDSSTTSATSSPLQSDITAPAMPPEWVLPTQFNSIDDAFSIKHFAYGRENVELLGSDIPMSKVSAFDSGETLIQVTYPRGSYSPSHQPRGGADFYAIPSFSSSAIFNQIQTDGILSLKQANNITLSYSVYFPPTFDFVKGGKLPGLYGGHEKCSGGDDGLGCFSTRLMWRAGGKGELYLYAPKNLQPASLCETPPRSICDSVYGLSIGRGSFTFKRGGWTHVSQTVWLNTPGLADGGFVLEISNDDDSQTKTVLSSGEVFYRDVSTVDEDIASSSINDLYSEDDEPTELVYSMPNTWNPLNNISPGGMIDTNELGGVSGLGDSWLSMLATSPFDILGSIPIERRTHERKRMPSLSSTPAIPAITAATVFVVEGIRTVAMPNYSTVTSTVTVTTTLAIATSAPSEQTAAEIDPQSQDVVGFIGIFFSTFFGGSTPDWASPRDQFARFKDFRVVINA